MEDSIKSKTQLKKEADDIQQFGIEISNLPNHKIKELSLSDEIIEAIIFYKEIKKNSAKRRQAQFLGKLLRDFDLSNVTQEMDTLKAFSRLQVKFEHEAELWRDKLINDQSALNEYINEFQPDLTNLNQTINAARKEFQSDKKSKNYRNLYRIILADIKKIRSAP
ncbi:MAG: ribosome biogenesis factor YjgA [Methylophilaceae bacterium]|jgi:ribosome-associated protein